MPRASIFPALLLLAGGLFLQAGTASGTEQNAGLWAALNLAGDVQPASEEAPWLWRLDVQYRLLFEADDVDQAYLGASMGRQIGSSAQLWGGYTYLRTDASKFRRRDENRLWQSLQFSGARIGELDIGLRSRIEQRWLRSSEDTGWRFRQLLTTRLPVSPGSRYALFANEELFVNLNDTNWNQSSGFNQNRLTLGLSVKMRHHRLNVGYLNQYVDNPSGEDLLNHFIYFDLSVRPQARRKN